MLQPMSLPTQLPFLVQ